MTAPRQPVSSKRGSLSAADYPALESFCGGYLHEDYVEEYGTPEEALRAFRTDADPDEREQLEVEAARFLAAAASLPFARVAEFIGRDLGAAWRPSTHAELTRLFRPSSRRA